MEIQPKIPRKFASLFNPRITRHFHWGGRQSAKTTSIATALVVEALTAKHKILCVRFNKSTSEDTQKAAVNAAVHRLGVEHLFQYSKTGAFICIPTGSEFSFKGLYQQHGLRGSEGVTRLWMEESQYLQRGTDGGDDFLDFTATIVREPNIKVYVSGNPRYMNDPAYAWCLEQRNYAEQHGETDLVWEHSTYRDNPWFSAPADRERRLQKRLDPGYYEHEWEGEFLSSLYDETFLTYELIGKCIQGFEEYKHRRREFLNRIALGFDPSDGSDKSIATARMGPFMEDVLDLTQAPGNVAIAIGKADKLARDHHAVSLTYDEGGMLGGQITRWYGLRQPPPYTLRRIGFGMAPGGPDVQYGLTPNKYKFRYRNSQMAQNLRDRAMGTWLLSQGEQIPIEDCLFIDPAAINGQDGRVRREDFEVQMVQPIMKRMGGQLIDMDKAPRGLDSPDIFDSGCLAYHDDVVNGLTLRIAI